MHFSTAPATFPDDGVRYWQIGALDLWVRRAGDGEWWVAYEHVPEREEALVEAVALRQEPAGLQWQRFAAAGGDRTLSLRPELPDRPLVLRPEIPLHLAGGAEGVFYGLLPCWIGLLVGGAVRLLDVPSVRLSSSWFGDPVSGVLCYGMRTQARRSPQELPPRPHRAVCTLRLRNRDDRPVAFERVCLEVASLAIYRGREHLWTSEVGLAYLGGGAYGDLEIGQAAPAAEPQAPLLTPARQAVPANTFMSRFRAGQWLMG